MTKLPSEIRAVLDGNSEGCIVCADCLDILPLMPDGCVDAVATDPPYGLKFMGKHWDCDVPSTDIWKEVLRVLKPGGHLLSFFGTRTYHRGVVAIEDAGFEIRDMISWVYGSGFPKSLDVSKAIDKMKGADREATPVGKPVKRMIPGADQNATGSWIKDNGREYQPRKEVPATAEAEQWDGWGTALKPACEPIVVARKPLIGTVAKNVMEHGTGALNIDGCRIPLNGDYKCGANGRPSQTGLGDHYNSAKANQHSEVGRWPANLIHDGSEEIVGAFPQTSPSRQGLPRTGKNGDGWGMKATGAEYADSGSAARFFYCAKASRSERTCGGRVENKHATVKPLALMRYLCRLATPPGGLVLDPFCGSGSTLLAARDEGFRFLGLDREQDYCQIAKDRLTALDTGVPVKEARAGQQPLFPVEG